MYHYVNDKRFISKMRRHCGEIMQDLCHILKQDYDIGANFYLVGSGARNLIMQNGGEAIDLDYNLEIVRCTDFKDGRYIKECAREAFNKALKKRKLRDCEDSTSSLTSKLMFFKADDTKFRIDVCITKRNERNVYYRLIHEKCGIVDSDRYYWDIARNLGKIKDKERFIKDSGKWDLVSEEYARLKNMYLTRNNPHPSFNCYIQAVNKVYYKCYSIYILFNNI